LKSSPHPKTAAILFENCPFALNYRRSSRFWTKVASGTRLRPTSKQAARVVAR
jgi:hypothetical protein